VIAKVGAHAFRHCDYRDRCKRCFDQSLTFPAAARRSCLAPDQRTRKHTTATLTQCTHLHAHFYTCTSMHIAYSEPGCSRFTMPLGLLPCQEGFKQFLGITPTVANWSVDGRECSLIIEDNPLTAFTELPDKYRNLNYCNLLCGVLRGALQMVCSAKCRPGDSSGSMQMCRIRGTENPNSNAYYPSEDPLVPPHATLQCLCESPFPLHHHHRTNLHLPFLDSSTPALMTAQPDDVSKHQSFLTRLFARHDLPHASAICVGTALNPSRDPAIPCSPFRPVLWHRSK